MEGKKGMYKTGDKVVLDMKWFENNDNSIRATIFLKQLNTDIFTIKNIHSRGVTLIEDKNNRFSFHKERFKKWEKPWELDEELFLV